MVQWLGGQNQGGRVAVSANFVLKWSPLAVHCNHIVLKKVSETCYPPSLFGNNLLYQVQDGGRSGVEIPITPVDPVAPDAGDVVEGLGGKVWRRVVECVGLIGGFWRYLVSLKTVISLSVALKSGSRSGVR